MSSDAADEAASVKLPITVIILAFNEELHIARCLTRIAPLVERIVVIDSFSTDRTVEIACEHGAEVLQHAFKNHSAQFQWGIEQACPTTDWVMRLDCDEYLEPAVIDELRVRLASLPDDVTGVTFKFKVIFKGRWIAHGRYYSTLQMRLWRNGAGQIEQRWMDEHIVLNRGRSERMLKGDLVDHNLNDIDWWIIKQNRYATLHMVDFINREYCIFREDNSIFLSNTPARHKRFLKNSVYGRMPIYIRAVMFYIYRYIFRLGFLDGKQGFVFHFMHGFWLYMLIDAKIDEARSFIKAHGIEAFRQDLRHRKGIDL